MVLYLNTCTVRQAENYPFCIHYQNASCSQAHVRKIGPNILFAVLKPPSRDTLETFERSDFGVFCSFSSTTSSKFRNGRLPNLPFILSAAQTNDGRNERRRKRQRRCTRLSNLQPKKGRCGATAQAESSSSSSSSSPPTSCSTSTASTVAATPAAAATTTTTPPATAGEGKTEQVGYRKSIFGLPAA